MNLLTDPLLRVETTHGPCRMTLPALLAALGQDEVEHLPGIQRHQEDAVHVFLSYLAGAVLVRHKETNPVQAEDFWRDGLRDLAGPWGDDPWTLIVPDPLRPAFLQPPLPVEDHAKLRPIASTPDGLDLLPTAKNHDLKARRAFRADPDEWVYAIISLQTMSGYYGRGNPGISRMNSGFGNRSVVELIRSPRPGIRWQDAVRRLLTHRQAVLSGNFGYDPQGLVLTWTEVWDGKQSLPLSQLDPFYIEVCRRVRLRGDTHIEGADSVPSDAQRIAAAQLRGVVGDGWLPVDVRETSGKDAGPKALTVGGNGFDAELMHRIIFEDGLQLTALHRPLPDWQGDVWISASVLVRGQGTTDGFRERQIAIPRKAQPRVFGPPVARQPFLELSRAAISCAATMQNRVLKPALQAYLAAAEGTTVTDRPGLEAWRSRALTRFEEGWTENLFPWLWSVPDDFEQEAMLADWARQLSNLAWEVLREAQRLLPDRRGRHYRARVASDQRFWGALYANFPYLKEERHEYSTVP